MRHPPHRLLPAVLAALASCVFAPSAARAQEPAPAAAPASSFKADYDALMKDFQEAQQRFYEEISQAGSDAEQMKLWNDASRNPSALFRPKFEAFALRAGKDPVAAEAWMWLLQQSADQQAGAILDVLLRDFLHTPAIAQVAQYLTYGEFSVGRERTLQALRTIRADSKDAAGKLQASLVLGIVQMRSAAEKDRAEGRELLAEVERTAAGTPIAASAAGFLFELDHLQVGMKAPEVEGTDQAGEAFRLSAYRGKVVVLDFWGFW